MSRFVLRFKGAGPKPEDSLSQLEKLHPNVKVVDQSSKMLLVEAPEDADTTLRETMPDWIVAPQREYSLPKPPIPKVRTT